MQTHALGDPQVYPTDEVVLREIGAVRPLWGSFIEHLEAITPAASREWRYYNDGKSWLLKVTQKARTLCWVSVVDGGFRMTCYFPGQFTSGKSFGKIRGVTIVFGRKADVDAA